MKNKGMQLGAMLAAMLLLSMVFVPGVMAQSGDNVKPNKDILIKGKVVKENIDEKYANGKNDSQILTHYPVSNGISIQAGKLWSANTDIYNYWPLSPAPRLDAYSKSRDNDLPWDINKIEVRGRVWKDNTLIFDNIDTRYNSADASIYWKSGCTLCAGSYTATGNHAFEESGYQSWYPVTQDSLNV